MNREALEALREKVEAGTDEYEMFCPLFHDSGLCVECDGAFGGSLDAANKVHDALLPGWHWLLRAPSDMDPFINHCKAGDYLANIWDVRHDPNEGDEHYSAWSPNPARAWLLAILSALLAEGGE